MTMRRQPHPRRKPAATRLGRGAQRLWLALVGALLLSLSWQSVVLQTHRHFAPFAGTATTRVASPDNQSPADLPSNCPICRELAHAGPVVLPAPVAIDAPAPLVFWFAVSVLLGLALVRRSHAWQSRAPPALLQP
jgi:hypothetical protein